ncbi:MAG TPA: recombinase family protein [Ktedonobacterales bacterium]
MPERTTDSTAGLAVYMRVSSEGQKTQGTIENQRALLDRHMSAYGITPVGWYQDDGVTGALKFASRPDGARLLADIKAGHVKIVLVTKLDRFGRNAREILNALYDEQHGIETHGARLISLKENVDTRTSQGRFFLTVLAGVAELERDMILERTAEGSARRLESTTWMGGHAPIGYRTEGEKKSARLVITDDVDQASGYSESDAARLAWVLLTEQDWTTERIAARLSELGIPTRTGKSAEWSPNVLYQMFTNTCYKGERTYRRADGTIIVQSVPALVSVEQWDRAQATLAAHRRATQRQAARDYPLRGLMRCGVCGALYTTSWTRRRDKDGNPLELWRYYACSTRHFRAQFSRTRTGSTFPQDCVGVAISARWVEGKIWADIEQLVRNPGDTLLELGARFQAAQATGTTHRAALGDTQAALDALQAERDTVMREYRKGRIDERTKDRQLDEIAEEDAEIHTARDAHTTAQRRAAEQAELLSRARTLLQQLHAQLDAVDAAQAAATTQAPDSPDASELSPAQVDLVRALVASISVSTVDDGISARGRQKRRAEVDCTYIFKLDALAEVQATSDTATELVSSSSAWR